MPELNAIGIAVSDMATSIRFYRLLGLDVPETPDEEHVDAFLPNGVPLHARLGGRDAELPRGLGAPRPATRSASRSSAGARPRSTRSTPGSPRAGFHGEKEPWDAFWGQRYALLLDPDGVEVSLYAALATA